MVDQTMMTHEQQVAFVTGAKERMDALTRGWLENPKVKAALLRVEPEAGEECKKAS